MIYSKMINLSFPDKNIKILIDIDYEKDIEEDIDKFNKSFDIIYNLTIEDILICDKIYQTIGDVYKKYTINISINVNDSYGYKNTYYKNIEKIITIENNQQIKGIIYNNNIDYNVYDIDSIPEDIKNKILGNTMINKDDPPVPSKQNNSPDTKLDLSGDDGLSSVITNTVNHIDGIDIDSSLLEKMKNPDYELMSTVKKFNDNKKLVG